MRVANHGSFSESTRNCRRTTMIRRTKAHNGLWRLISTTQLTSPVRFCLYLQTYRPPRCSRVPGPTIRAFGLRPARWWRIFIYFVQPVDLATIAPVGWSLRHVPAALPRATSWNDRPGRKSRSCAWRISTAVRMTSRSMRAESSSSISSPIGASRVVPSWLAYPTVRWAAGSVRSVMLGWSVRIPSTSPMIAACA